MSLCRLGAALTVGVRLGDTSGDGAIAPDATGFTWKGTHYARMALRQREVRVGTPQGMVTLRREDDGITLVTWGNADGELRQAWNAVAWALARLTGGRQDGPNGPARDIKVSGDGRQGEALVANLAFTI